MTKDPLVLFDAVSMRRSESGLQSRTSNHLWRHLELNAVYSICGASPDVEMQTPISGLEESLLLHLHISFYE
jgi:hypothetical protein